LSKFLRLDPRKRHLLGLIPYLKKYQALLIFGATMVLLTNVVAVIFPWILRNAIDHLYQEISRDILLYYALLMIAASILEGMFRFLMRRILIGVSLMSTPSMKMLPLGTR